MSLPPNSDTPPLEQSAPQTAAAQAFNAAMQPAIVPSAVAQTPLLDNMKDTVMSDRAPDRPDSPAIGNHSPAPPRIGTPNRNTNGNDVTSRATSQHPDPVVTIPKEAPPHGAPTRQYLNGKVTGPLLDGMKIIAKEQPRDPLRVLGEYLLQRSREIEGTQ